MNDTQMNDKQVLVLSEKHWISYVLPALAAIVALYLLFLGKYWWILSCILLGYAVWSYFVLRSVSLTLTDKELIIKSGVLPWNRTYFNIPVYDIYEAFYEKGMISYLLGYGTVSIRRTDGVSTAFSYTYMTRYNDMVGQINALIRQEKEALRNAEVARAEAVRLEAERNAEAARNAEVARAAEANRQTVTNANTFSVADEISKLNSLKLRGLITEEEFQQQKQRLMQNA